MLHNLIRIPEPDTPIYRTFPYGRFREVLQKRELALVAPSLWDDPFENFLARCAINYMHNGQRQQECFDRVLRPVYAQCWSLAVESDALWRIYSKVDKDHQTGRNKMVEHEGVKVRTTASKLLGALWNAIPIQPSNSCFLGQVKYMPQDDAVQYVANEIIHERLNYFTRGVGQARALLMKREPFEHEREIRLIFVDHSGYCQHRKIFTIEVNPGELFEEAVLDPRLHPDDVSERKAELHTLGFNGPIIQSDL